MKVREAKKIEWENYISQCEHATFFHTHTWYAIWEAYANYKAKALLIEFPSGNTALLPLSERTIHKGFTKVYDSSPAGTYGGFISQNSLTSDEVSQLMAYAKKMTINITFNPYQELEGLGELKKDFTQRINLRKGVEMKKWHRFTGRVNKSKALVVRWASSAGEWQAYLKLYKKSLVRWGDKVSSVYDDSFFVLLQQLPKGVCQLLTVCKENKVVYGGIFFFYNNVMTYWHGAGDEVFFKEQPAFLMQTAGIKYAMENGYNYYDFNPSGGHKGVEKFKNHFNPEKVSFPIWSNQNDWFFTLDNLSKFLKKSFL